MADIIDYKIYGDDLQLLEIELDPKEGVRAEAGTMTKKLGYKPRPSRTALSLFS
jgi:uncharacterized protein (AIM24 family)